MFTLINTAGTIHNFACKMTWGHNIEGSDAPVQFGYADTIVNEYTWTVFNPTAINAGDFIIRRSYDFKRTILYEVISSSRTKFSGTSFGPTDCYDVVARHCGYYDMDTKQSTIFSGYGVFPPHRKNFLERCLEAIK